MRRRRGGGGLHERESEGRMMESRDLNCAKRTLTGSKKAGGSRLDKSNMSVLSTEVAVKELISSICFHMIFIWSLSKPILFIRILKTTTDQSGYHSNINTM